MGVLCCLLSPKDRPGPRRIPPSPAISSSPPCQVALSRLWAVLFCPALTWCLGVVLQGIEQVLRFLSSHRLEFVSQSNYNRGGGGKWESRHSPRTDFKHQDCVLLLLKTLFVVFFLQVKGRLKTWSSEFFTHPI